MSWNYRERIARLNPRLNAYVDLTSEPIGDGFAWAIKSNIAVKGLPCTGGIAAYRSHIAPDDADIIAAIRRAGGQCILGTVNMHEGALGATTDNEAFGRTHNPWMQNYTPGGSSGGSGAAVAAGLCDVALGTDTMGSIRIPASYCGVQGFKPTRGLLSTQGIMPLSNTLDHAGPLARDVETLWKAMSIMGAWGEEESLVLHPVRDLRFGLWFGNNETCGTRQMEYSMNRLCEWFEENGGHALDFSPPGYDYSVSRRAGLLISEIEGEAYHHDTLVSDPDGFSDLFRRLLRWGAAQPAEKHRAAYEHVRQIEHLSASVWSSLDVVIAPVAPQAAFSFETEVPANQADFTAWANMAGLPAASVWIGQEESGMPFGLQIIGAKGDDRRVLQIAAAIEEFAGKPPFPSRCI